LYFFNLTSGVPRAEEVDAAGEEASLEYTQDHAEASQLVVVLDEAHANHDGAPGQRDGGKMGARADSSDNDGRWGLEDNICGEEDEIGNVISHANQVQLDAHARNVGGAHVGPVHETNAVENADGGDEAAIDAANNAALLLRCEIEVVGRLFALGRDLPIGGVGLVEVSDLAALLLVLMAVFAIGPWGLHGGRLSEQCTTVMRGSMCIQMNTTRE
jgi:hypothetical protein